MYTLVYNECIVLAGGAANITTYKDNNEQYTAKTKQ